MNDLFQFFQIAHLLYEEERQKDELYKHLYSYDSDSWFSHLPGGLQTFLVCVGAIILGLSPIAINALLFYIITKT